MAEKKKAEVAVETPEGDAAPKPKAKLLVLGGGGGGAANLFTMEGKQKLSADIVGQANQIICAKKPAQDGVVGVYFTSFVIQ